MVLYANTNEILHLICKSTPLPPKKKKRKGKQLDKEQGEAKSHSLLKKKGKHINSTLQKLSKKSKAKEAIEN